jgi:hypothetical protein
MTDEELWKIEGRTRDLVTDVKRILAALQSDIEEYPTKLNVTSESLRHVLSEPIGPGPTGTSSLQHTLNFFRDFIPEDIQQKLVEFESESERLQKLEKTLNGFDGK